MGWVISSQKIIRINCFCTQIIFLDVLSRWWSCSIRPVVLPSILEKYVNLQSRSLEKYIPAKVRKFTKVFQEEKRVA